MDISTYVGLNIKDSIYVSASVGDLLFDSEYVSIRNNIIYKDIYITDSMRETLCRYVGLTPSLNKGLYSVDKDLWYQVLYRLYKFHGKDKVILLLSTNEDGYFVKGICNSTREPLSNLYFINKVLDYSELFKDAVVDDISVSDSGNISEVVILSSKEYTSFHNRPFNVGVVFKNDETQNVTCRMVMKYTDSEVYYLPSKMYNLSSSRYDRTSENSKESLEMLLLRVSEDFATDYYDSVSDQIRTSICESSSKSVSYQEFDRLKLVIVNMARSSDLIEEEISEIVEVIDKYNDFEVLYGKVCNDYLWKCTAISETTLDDLLGCADRITCQYKFYPECVTFLRDLLGEYLIDSRICQHIAKRV